MFVYSLIDQYYDPRVWVREGEKTLSARVKEACADLGNVGAFFLISPFLERSLSDLSNRPAVILLA